MITKITSAEVLRALPEGSYQVNNIAAMNFRIENGVIVCRNGRTRTFESFSAFINGGSIVGPHIELEEVLSPEEFAALQARIEENRSFAEAYRRRVQEEHEEWVRWLARVSKVRRRS